MSGRVVIVGAGLSGLACALHLAGAGREVTILERGDRPGGLAGERVVDGWRFDTGPTVLTAPDILDRTFAAVGERTADRLTLRRLDPAYRGFFGDAGPLDVRADPEDMAEYLRAECGPGDAEGYRRYAAHVAELYRLQIDDFIDRNLDTPRDLVTANLFGLVARGGFGRLAPLVDRHFRDERLRRLFSFQSLYIGLAPRRALALYAVISYLDAIAGVWYPEGGIHQVPEALAAAAVGAGVRIHYGSEARAVELRGDRAVAVTTATGERHAAGDVVLATDEGAALRLLGRPRARRRFRHAPSCAVVQLGGVDVPAGLEHHNIFFGRAWDRTFDDIIGGGRVMRDPSLLVTNPGRTDPADAGTLYVLAPTPNLDDGPDWRSRGDAYTGELLAVLAKRGLPLDAGSVRTVTTPADWADAGYDSGTPFSLAHTFGQTGPFRPGTRVRGLANVVRCGAGVQPGVGVPMVLLSGGLAARRVLGRR
ncbi:phytoene desaturase family protein [Phytomonospora endophytica]|uniref:Phytoene desaturase n=1 Tax=Phytomonospora endophytica TaxID=714109 RepID=A0A841FGM0_9ACTN|nr:phytoene desaturase family protein [Phytomonospora endophytica]MBB6035014.1 phytoene desaturase [Phytomonospora endophytica]